MNEALSIHFHAPSCPSPTGAADHLQQTDKLPRQVDSLPRQSQASVCVSGLNAQQPSHSGEGDRTRPGSTRVLTDWRASWQICRGCEKGSCFSDVAKLSHALNTKDKRRKKFWSLPSRGAHSSEGGRSANRPEAGLQGEWLQELNIRVMSAPRKGHVN